MGSSPGPKCKFVRDRQADRRGWSLRREEAEHVGKAAAHATHPPCAPSPHGARCPRPLPTSDGACWLAGLPWGFLPCPLERRGPLPGRPLSTARTQRFPKCRGDTGVGDVTETTPSWQGRPGPPLDADGFRLTEATRFRNTVSVGRAHGAGATGSAGGPPGLSSPSGRWLHRRPERAGGPPTAPAGGVVTLGAPVTWGACLCGDI